MSTAIPSDARFIQPTGLPLAILIISCVFWILSVIGVSARTYTRIVTRALGVDDAFIIFGTVAYTVATGLTIYCVYSGLGRLTEDLNAWQASEAMKYYIIWILVYVNALATVKSSICITIMRIASMNKNLRYAVYSLLAVTWASYLITFVGTLLYCRPVSAIWTPSLIASGKGSCAPVETFIIIAHTATVSTILTDLGLVVVPAVMLWNTQMKKQQKLQAFGLLSFASVASVITMVRIPYVNRFEAYENLPFWVAHIILCSNVETGIGCIASSMPSFRHFIRRDTSNNGYASSGPSNRNTPNPSKNFFTIGSRRRDNISDRFSLGTVRHEREDWEQLHDGASDKSDAPLDTRGMKSGGVYGNGIEVNDVELYAEARKIAA